MSTSGQSANSIEVSGMPVAPPSQPLTLMAAQVAGNQFSFRFTAQAGSNYDVQFQESLTTGTWLNLTNINAGVSSQEALITDSISASSQRFYRVQANPIQ